MSINDCRLPDDFACYQCLLQPHESRLFQHLTVFALYRRALMLVWARGLPRGNKGMSKLLSAFHGILHRGIWWLGCSISVTNDIIRHLLSHGFLEQKSAAKGKVKGSLAVPSKSYASLTTIKNDENRNKMMNDYFDPEIGISHLVFFPPHLVWTDTV